MNSIRVALQHNKELIMLRDTCGILSTPAWDVHVRLKTTGTEIKIAKETTNNQDKKYHGDKYEE